MKSLKLILLLALVSISVSKKKVLVATDKPFAKPAVVGIKEAIEKAGYEMILLEKYKEKANLLKAVENVDAMIVRSDKVDAEVLSHAKNLKIVVRAGAGFDNIDLEAATKHGVVVMNTPGQNSNAVAELALGLMVFSFRNLFNGKSGSELKGRKLGIHAYGNVGRNVARIAKGFGMECIAYDAFVPKEAIEKDGVKAVDTVEELYKSSDIITLHIPALKETIHSINYNLLSLMSKDGLLVNTARKEVINEEELIKIMKERPKFKYISDVAPDKEDEFKEFGERYFATPKKMGAQTTEANTNAGIAAANQIVGFFENGDVKFQLNKELLIK